MQRACGAMTATADLVVQPAIELWIELPEADPFRVFEAMRAAGVDDVRKVGVLCRTPEEIDAARRAGVAAVVSSPDLAHASPDLAVAASDFDAAVADRWPRPMVLLNPGPALTTDAVKRAAAGVDMCHREPEYQRLDRRVRDKLRAVAGVGADWPIALLSGSGTAANETAVRASVREGKRMLVVVNGVYGERLLAQAQRAGIDTVEIRGPWTEPIDLAAVQTALAIERDVDALAVVHHETTTGLLNPLSAVAGLAAVAGVRTVVDAVSSFGIEDVDLAAGVDFMTCSSNKGLHGLPGAAFVLVSPAGARRARSVDPTSVALDLCTYLDGETNASPPFTPAIPALASLDVALDRVVAEGVAGRQARYAARCAVLDTAFERLGLEQLIAPAARSHSIRSLRLPEGISFAALHERLRAAGFVVYAGQGTLAKEIFRVACMGELELDDLHRFVASLDAALAELRA